VGSDWKIRTSDRANQTEVSERPPSRSCFTVIAHPCILLHRKVWRSGLDDHANVISGFEQRISHRVRPH
jgi:hypothetical protein